MVLDFLIGSVFNAIRAIFSLLPDIPDVPTTVSDLGTNFFGYIANSIGVIIVFTGAPLFYFAITVLTVLLLFEPLYAAFHWLLRKLPLSSH